MAVEAKRGCGYRKVGGLYLIGVGLACYCDRLPLEIIPCPTCGEAPRFNRGISKINPLKLWGDHREIDKCNCQADKLASCPVCHPGEKAWLMWVGKQYTTSSFVLEALNMGVSKRISKVPDDLELGIDWVLLAYLKVIPRRKGNGQMLLDDDEDVGKTIWYPGIFYVFRPTAVEKIITKSQSKDESYMRELDEKNIIPVVVPDDDPDHNSRIRSKDDGSSIGFDESSVRAGD